MTDSAYHLHIVLGGELTTVGGVKFRDPSQVEFCGAYANYDDARAAWKARAQATVDNAHMRYFILDAGKLLDPDGDGVPG
jgi:glucose dehydrogenase